MADTDDHLDRQRVRRVFDASAAAYDEAAVLQRHVAEELDARIGDLDHQPDRILDIGCGTGLLTRHMLTRFPDADVFALDFAPAMAARTAAINPGRTICGDAEALPLAPGCIDLAVSSLVLNWCDFERVFEAVRSVLRPGGLWLFSTVGPDTLMELREAWRQVDGAARVHEFVDMHHLGDALLALNFRDPVLDVDRVNIAYADVATLLRDLKTLGVVNARPERSRGLLGRRRFADLVRAYERFRDPAGDLPSTWEVVYAHAWMPASAGSVKVEFDAGRAGGGLA